MESGHFAAVAVSLAILATSAAAGAPSGDWLSRLNAPAAIPRQRDWVPACRRCANDFYSPSSVRVNSRTRIVRLAVEHRESPARSRRHVLTINCRDRTLVEGHAYRFSRGRFIGVDTFENDADAFPWSDFADDYEPLYRRLCRTQRRGS